MTAEIRPVLHGYFRSSASWRVRIALNHKGVAHDHAFHRLLKGEQRTAEYLAVNPQGLVPALEVDGQTLTQSIAICEYLEEIFPEPPLLPADPVARARVRAFMLAIACEIHPLQNIGTLARLRALGLPKDAVAGWPIAVINDGFAACAQLIANEAGPYCFGNEVTLADVCLIPQMANARRYGARTDWPRFESIEAACLALPAFALSRPEAQPDYE